MFRIRRIVLRSLLFLLPALPAVGQDLRWAMVKNLIRVKFPAVRHVSADSLSAWMHRRDEDALLLLDTRPEEEFSIGHLADAVRIDPDQTDWEVLSDVPRDRRIVTYCSVGYRSSAVAERLSDLGFADVHNLDGGIFEWANESRPVYRGEMRVRKVHPYDSRWGKLLDPSLRASIES